MELIIEQEIDISYTDILIIGKGLFKLLEFAFKLHTISAPRLDHSDKSVFLLVENFINVGSSEVQSRIS